ncbi:MAG: carboxypeptidase regulatory-like domain-containing protein [Candidatus Thiothrix sulfatifontis]|nr:MAG: carboxypeptidase regulatory-like domain-containing protein [Candidatus Thiothrix sulfatifontis]
MIIYIRLILLVWLIMLPVGSYASYNIDRSSTTTGSSYWGSNILRMDARISGTYLYITASKQTGTFSSTGTMYLKTGSPETYGVNRTSGTIYADSSSIALNHDLAAYTGYPKDFYIRYESNDGGWAWAGPIRVSSAAPTVSGLSGNQTLKAGESYRLVGTVNAGSGDSLSSVTAAVTGPGISTSNKTAMNRDNVNAASFSLSNFTFSTATFSTPGVYTVGIWAKTVQHPSPANALGSFTVTVASATPSVSGLSGNQTLKAGESYRLVGTVNAGSGDSLSSVTAAVTGPGISTSNKTAMNRDNVNAASFSLSNFTFSTATFSTPGVYTVGIWAKTVQHPSPANALGSFTVTVASATPSVSGLSGNQTLKAGESYRLVGTVNAGSGDSLSSVTAAVTGPGISTSNKTAMNRDNVNAASFSLSNFTFSTATFSTPGVYTVGIWAKTVQHPSPANALGSFTVNVSKSKYINVSDWAQDAADFMVTQEIVDNPTSYDLRGTTSINRAELATMLYRALGGGKSKADIQFETWAGGNLQSTFLDINDASVWYYDEVAYLSRLQFDDLVSVFDRGYEQGMNPLFKPSSNISRAWALKAILESWNLSPLKAFAVDVEFDDVPFSHPAAGYIYSALENGLIKGDGDQNTYRPDIKLNREDVFVILHRLMDKSANIKSRQINKPLIDGNDFFQSDFNDGEIGIRYEQPVCHNVIAPNIVIQRVREGVQTIDEAELYSVDLQIGISGGSDSCIDSNKITNHKNLFAAWRADGGTFVDLTPAGETPFSKVRWIAPDRYSSGTTSGVYRIVAYVGNNLGIEVSETALLQITQVTPSLNKPTVSLNAPLSQVRGGSSLVLSGIAQDGGDTSRANYGIREVMLEYSFDGVTWNLIERNIPIDKNNRWEVEWSVPDIYGNLTIRVQSMNLDGNANDGVITRSIAVVPEMRITGYVLSDGGEPWVNAQVILGGKLSTSTLTDNYGSFDFGGLEAGVYTLQAKKDDISSKSTEITLTANAPKPQIEIILQLTAFDTDGDGYPDDKDAFPNDPKEWLDTDGNGIGNNADPDDDNDGMPDTWEAQHGFDSLNSTDATQDADKDSFTNKQEYDAGTDPNNAKSYPVTATISSVTPNTAIVGKRLELVITGKNLTGSIDVTLSGCEDMQIRADGGYPQLSPKSALNNAVAPPTAPPPPPPSGTLPPLPGVGDLVNQFTASCMPTAAGVKTGIIRDKAGSDYILKQFTVDVSAASEALQFIGNISTSAMNFDDANKYCKDRGTRLPTIEELRNAYQLTDTPLSILTEHAGFKVLTQETGLWSSTPNPDISGNYYVIYGNETWAWQNSSKQSKYFVHCVGKAGTAAPDNPAIHVLPIIMQLLME